MARTRKFSSWRAFFWLLPIPLGWILLSQWGLLRTLDHMTMDWRFLVRGPIEAPCKIFYINRDQTTSRVYAESPFPRELYAHTIQAAFGLGRAKAIFFDFILSPLSLSRAMNPEFLVEQDETMAGAVQEHDRQIVLACGYTNTILPFSTIYSHLPREYLGAQATPENPFPYDPQDNPYPESPTFPIWNIAYAQGDMIQPRGWGRTGMINVEVELSHGPEARWMPLYVEMNNEYHTLNNVLGRISYYRAKNPEIASTIVADETSDPDAILIRAGEEILQRMPRIIPHTVHTVALELLAAAHNLDSKAIVIDRTRQEVRIEDFWNEQVLYAVPMAMPQVMEINWFSPWISLGPGTRDLTAAVEEVILAAEVLGKHPDLQEEFFRFIPSSPGDLFPPLRERYPRNESRQTLVPQRLYDALDLLLQAPVDPYNPMASMAVVLSLQELHEYGNDLVKEKVARWFERLQDAIVLCGPTDPILQDIAPTPFDQSNVPRVSVHGNLVKTIASGKYLRRPPDWMVPLITLFLTIVVTLSATASGLHEKMSKAGAMLLIILYAVSAFYLFARFHLVLPLIEPVGAALTTSLAGFAIQLVREEKEKTRIRGMFGSYLSPALVNRMIDTGEDPRLGGSESTITAFFSDVQGFSTFSEVLTPQQLVELMNEFLSAMTDILESEEGTLDKYIGDAIVAMFGAPVKVQEPALHACLAAIRMQERLGELRAKWKSEPGKWPLLITQMRMRIGLNSGKAVVGNMGSTKRFSFTMMGDTVNLASRCESGAKTAGVFTLAADDTRREVEATGAPVVFRHVSRWRVKGRAAAVDMHEVVGRRGSVPDSMYECMSLYEKALGCFFQQDWEGALGWLEKSTRLEWLQPGRDPGVQQNASTALAKIIHQLRQHPPGPHWDGVYEMTEK